MQTGMSVEQCTTYRQMYPEAPGKDNTFSVASLPVLTDEEILAEAPSDLFHGIKPSNCVHKYSK